MMMTKIFHLRTPHFFGCDPLRTVVVFGVHSLAVCVLMMMHSTLPLFFLEDHQHWRVGPLPNHFFLGLALFNCGGSSSIAAGCDVDYSLAKPSLALICNWTFSYGNFLCSSIVVKEPEPEEESRGKIFTHAMPLSMLSFFFFIYKPKNPKVIHSLLMHNCCFCVSRGLGLSHIM